MNLMSPTKKSILYAIPFVVLLGLHAWYYLPFLSDDALISMRYSQRLVEGHGLTWTGGKPVEGYSNLLWVLVVALPHWLGVDLLLTVRALGLAFSFVVIIALRPRGGRVGDVNDLGSWVGMAFAAGSAPLAIWAIGGLEQALLGGLLALAVVLLFRVLDGKEQGRRVLIWLSVSLGLICITRPDGPIFVVAAVLPLFLSARSLGMRQALSRVGILIVGPILLYGGQLVFRLAYYDDYVPNTARVKISPSANRSQEGWDYVQSGFMALGPLSFVALVLVITMLLRSGTRWKGAYLAIALLLWNSYLVVIGGDIFLGHRHFVVNVVLLAFALKHGLQGLDLNGWRPFVRRALACALLFLFIPFGWTQFDTDSNKETIEERWEWGGREVGLWLKRAFQEEQPLMAVTAAGCLPFWSEFPCLDMLGLNDHYLPRHLPENFGSGPLGHELGSADYVLGREPDIIAFHTGIGPCFHIGSQLGQSALALKMYSPVSIDVDPTGLGSELRSLLFFHRYSPKVGMRKVDEDLVLAAYLFTELKALAYFNEEGRIEVELVRDQPLEFHFTPTDDLNWKVKNVVGADSAHVNTEVEFKGGMVWVRLTTESTKPVHFESVVLESE